MLQRGEQVPDVELLNMNEEKVRLRELIAGKVAVIYFYPADDTPVCTMQACGFRDNHEEFLDAGAEVIGISADPPASHRSFANKHGLPFTLLSDTSGEAREAFGVQPVLGFIGGRTTFVVDRQGTIRMSYSSMLRARTHVKEALTKVQELASASG